MTAKEIKLSSKVEKAIILLETSKINYLNKANFEMVVASEGGISFGNPKDTFHSAIIYEDNIKLFTLTQSELAQIIALKKEICDAPLVDHNKFAFQRTHSKEEVAFCFMCDKKNISSKAKALQL